jgi:hypothetical protein
VVINILLSSNMKDREKSTGRTANLQEISVLKTQNCNKLKAQINQPF